mmetsp:Transcript_4546/g.7810  ORF Transcript_4546/g.7810 Transcript_4546/m.7810 type:complete len:307 (-) Transcript_4546:516-1436(-)
MPLVRHSVYPHHPQHPAICLAAVLHTSKSTAFSPVFQIRRSHFVSLAASRSVLVSASNRSVRPVLPVRAAHHYHFPLLPAVVSVRSLSLCLAAVLHMSRSTVFSPVSVVFQNRCWRSHSVALASLHSVFLFLSLSLSVSHFQRHLQLPQAVHLYLSAQRCPVSQNQPPQFLSLSLAPSLALSLPLPAIHLSDHLRSHCHSPPHLVRWHLPPSRHHRESVHPPLSALAAKTVYRQVLLSQVLVGFPVDSSRPRHRPRQFHRHWYSSESVPASPKAPPVPFLCTPRTRHPLGSPSSASLCLHQRRRLR